jgi:hypothetical protein
MVKTIEENIDQETLVSFRKCPLCEKEWRTMDEFLNDPTVSLNGYQGNLRRLLDGREQFGLLLFTHHVEECGTTLAFEPTMFKHKQ